jgi:PAS domain S-box-containing protein
MSFDDEPVVLERDRSADGESSAVSEQLFRLAFDNAPVGMTVVGPDGRWLRVNREVCRILGYERDELIGRHSREFTHPGDLVADRLRLAAAFDDDDGSELEREKRYVHKNGSVVWASTRSERMRDETGHTRFLVVHVMDLTERRLVQAQRRDSDRRLHAIMDNSPAIISVKGADHRYELVTRGFEEWCGLTSEQIIGQLSETLPLPVVSGDEWAREQVVLDGAGAIQDEETGRHDGAERTYLTTRFPLLDDEARVTAVCISRTDVTERREEERLKRDRLQASVQIHEALAQDRFVLFGQPIVNLASMQVEQAELLLRMKAPAGGGLLAPGEFLPAAERFDLISMIDEWVVDQAVKEAAAGHRVEVNLSAKTISNPSQVARTERAVIDSGCPPENLIFEITETAIAEHRVAARELALRLRALGCAFALDDFGVGHGTFTYLKHLAVDYLKIDLQFVRDLLRHDADRQVVQAIIGVARQFDIRTIAEGVEDEETLDALRAMGADYAQGYWIGRPQPLAPLGTPPANRE